MEPLNPEAEEFLSSLHDAEFANPTQQAWLSGETNAFVECVKNLNADCLEQQYSRLIRAKEPGVMRILPRVMWARFVSAQPGISEVEIALPKYRQKFKNTTALADIMFTETLISLQRKNWADATKAAAGLSSFDVQPIPPPMASLRSISGPTATTYLTLAPELKNYIAWKRCPVSVMVTTKLPTNLEDLARLRKRIIDIGKYATVAEPISASANLLRTRIFVQSGCEIVGGAIAGALDSSGLITENYAWDQVRAKVGSASRQKIAADAAVLVQYGDEVREKILGR